MHPPKGRILVIRGGAIGDFILTLPAIAALRQQFPGAHIEVLGYPHIVQLAVAGGLVDRVQPIEARAMAGFFARGGSLAEELVDYFSEFDLIISYLYDPDGIFQGNVALCTGAQFITGPHRPDEQKPLHATMAFLKPLERLAIFDADPIPTLPISPNPNPDPNLNLNPNPSPTLALHPGSGSESKNWPEANWAALLDQLIRSTKFDLLLVGGEAEAGRLERLGKNLPPHRVRYAQNLPLSELARLLASCDGFVGHDSGISHVAAALGLPSLLLWGDTPEAVWRPPSAKVTLLRHPAGLANLEVAEVLGAILAQWFK
jgi:heptosyltransferase III